MKVLLSIKPEYALSIFEGLKRFEYRRVIFRRKEVKSVVVYASAPISKVLGEFEVEDILYENPANLWIKTREYAGISRRLFFEYFSNIHKGYAIKVKNSIMYEKPIPLKNFMILSPPQSFMYLKYLQNRLA